MSTKRFIPEITINNTREKREVDVDGEVSIAEFPAKEGFNIRIKNSDGTYEKKYFLKELEGVILTERYFIQSKYNAPDKYSSSEFSSFSGIDSHVVVRSYKDDKSEVIFEGPYSDCRDFFSTGEKNAFGKDKTTYDVYTVLYVLINGETFRFKWKMNQNNNWFRYKQACAKSKFSRDPDYRDYTTKFALEKKKVGTNDFWACNLINVGTVNNREDIDNIANMLLDELNNNRKEVEIITEINPDDIPF